jgi:2-keto-4-pentenoate hydratase/2-oxohepta-3-ene-1,7-dioic acid hydratase in catechol pathway
VFADILEEVFLKLIRVGAPRAEVPGVVLADGSARDARSVTNDFDAAFFASGGVQRLRAALDSDSLPPLATDVRVGSPIARPGKVVCVGLNYHEHARETGSRFPDEPVLFMKAPNTVIGPQDEVLIPRGSLKTDWEVELGVVIGSTARYLSSPSESAAHIGGYAVSHDVSEREFQLERGGQWDKGKSCETFNPLGPYLVTADEVPDPQALSLQLWVNGELRQDGNTADMVFPVNHLIWYISQFMVLEPGDVVNTGTPAGVALGMPDPVFLRAGDVVELEIAGLGRQRQVLGQA